MTGPHCGRYVSDPTPSEAVEMVKAFEVGDEIFGHLMRRNRSGHHEPSTLRFETGGSVTRFSNWEELTWPEATFSSAAEDGHNSVAQHRRQRAPWLKSQGALSKAYLPRLRPDRATPTASQRLYRRLPSFC